MATFNGQVSTGADDGYVTTEPTYEPSLDFVSFGKQSTTIVRSTWLRFQNVTIPQGSTINSATLSMRAYASASTTTVNVTIRCFDEDDAAAISSESDYTGRDSTTAVVNWNNIGAWTADTWYDAPDLASVVQEIVDRGGWSSGNAIMFRIVDNSSSADARRTPYAYEGGSASAATIEIDYTLPNTAPTITVAPTVSYGNRTRSGPENTPAVVSFTATDPEETAAGELNWGIYTATAGGGTQVASGTCTSGVQEQVNIAYNASGLSEGSNTLYLLVSDGTDDDEESFTLLVDETAPVTFTATADPSTVSTRLYAVELTAQDATSTATDELTWQVRTAASGAGSLLAHGTRTSSGTAFTTSQFIDPALEDGSNTRYVRVIDGAGNVREESFTVTGDDLPVPVVADTPYSRARPQAVDLITIAIYRPLGQYINGTRAPLDTLDINPGVTAVSWGSVLPGGWSGASVGIAHPNHDDRYGEPPRRPWLPREMAFGAFHHVEFRRHGRVLYAGRMGTQQRAYGRATGFTVQGYGMVATHDMYYRNTSDTVVSSGALLRAVIAATAPHLIAAPDGDLWQDPGVGHAYSEFNRMYLGDVLDQIAAEGDSAANMVDWTVFEEQMVRLQVRREPERADYLVPWSMVPDYVEDTSGLAGAASYERVMAGGGAVTSASDYITPGFIDTYGIQRGHLLTVGQISQTAAIAMTKAYLELHKRPVVSATIEAGPDVRLESPGGREMPREGVRAGQWVQIEGMDYPLVIVSTDYDAFADVVRIQAGEFMPDFGMLLASIQKDRRKWQRRMNYYAGKSL